MDIPHGFFIHFLFNSYIIQSNSKTKMSNSHHTFICVLSIKSLSLIRSFFEILVLPLTISTIEGGRK